jgi:hypothetical protein
MPGFGKAPAPLAGRNNELTELGQAFAGPDQGRGGVAVRLIGLRGNGKSSLLTELERRLTDSGELSRLVGRPRPAPWVVLRGEAGGTDLIGELVEDGAAFMAQLRPGRGWNVAGGLSVGVANLSVTRSEADPERSVGRRLRALADAVAEEDRNLVVLVDELHEATQEELRTLASSVNRGAGGTRPMVLVTAELPDRLQLDRITYFRDRAMKIHVGSLDAVGAAAAILGPAEALGVTWERAAVDEVVQAAAGFPYALAVYGHQTWLAARAAGASEHITVAHATTGVARGQAGALAQLYRDRWERLTGRQQRYLTAAARARPEGGPIATATVAAALGEPASRWSGDMGDLRSEGALLHQRRGEVTIALPGWAHWITSRAQPRSSPSTERTRGRGGEPPTL